MMMMIIIISTWICKSQEWPNWNWNHVNNYKFRKKLQNRSN